MAKEYTKQTRAELEQLVPAVNDRVYVVELNEQYGLISNGKALDGDNVIDAIRARIALGDDNLRWDIVTTAGNLIGGGGGIGTAKPSENEFFVDVNAVEDKPNRIFNAINDVFSDGVNGIPSKDTTNETFTVIYFTNQVANITAGFIDNVIITPYRYRAAKLSGTIVATSSANGTPAIIDCSIDGASISTTGSTKLKVVDNFINAGSTVDNTGGSGMEFEKNSLDGSAGTNPIVTFSGSDFICNNRFFFGDAIFKGAPNTVTNNIFVLGVLDVQTNGLSVIINGGTIANCTLKGNLDSNISLNNLFFASNNVPNTEEVGINVQNSRVISNTFDHQPTALTIMEFTQCTFTDNTFGANYDDALLVSDTVFNNCFLSDNTDSAGAGSTFVFNSEAAIFA